MRALALVLLAVLGCAHRGPRAPTLTLGPACPDDQRREGDRCVARTAAAAFTASAEAARGADVPAALAALDAATTEPLDLASHVRLWEERGILRAYLADAESTDATEGAATAAFDRLLAIDPEHQLNCELGNKATLRFERTRARLAERAARELELTWPRTTRLGDRIPLDIETVADPTGVLATLALYARARGAAAWQVAEVPVPPIGTRTRIYLPAIRGTASTGLEIYAVAADRDGNQTLAWASGRRPRDIPLRYDPPTPWYRTWWVWAIAGGAVAVGAGITTYALTWTPSGEVGGTVGGS